MFRSLGPRLALTVAAFSWACSDDGHTPVCPVLPLYKVGQPVTDETEAALAEAAEAGCITPPIGGASGSD